MNAQTFGKVAMWVAVGASVLFAVELVAIAIGLR